MRGVDELLYRADLSVLYDAINKLTKMSEKHFDKKEVAHMVFAFDKFVRIHETRTDDLLFYKEKINKARSEYASMKMQRDGWKEKYELQNEILTNLMNNSI